MSVTIGPAAIRWYVAHTDNSPGHPSAGYESDPPFSYYAKGVAVLWCKKSTVNVTA
jgi:hypothetical protein